MYATERYLSLMERFSGDSAPGSPVEATLDGIAAALFCTPRNAKLILRRLQEEQLIEWLPGRGRGHRSRIVFRHPKEPYLMELLQAEAEAGNYPAAFELIGQYAGGTAARERFLQWLDGRFGYLKEQQQGQPPRDTLRFPLLYGVRTLDPSHLNYALDAHVMRQLYDRLLQYSEENERIIPAAAHHWSVNGDGTVWTFFLRKGVLFHDGAELNSRDVAFTFERLRHGFNRWLMRSVRSVETVGSHVVRFYLEKPNFIFDRFVCAGAAALLPEGLRGLPEEEFWKRPIGTGPFRLLKHTSCGLELGAHEPYYGGRPYLDAVDMVVLPESCQPASVAPSVPGLLRIRDGFYHEPETAPPSEEWSSIHNVNHGCAMLGWNMNKPGPHQSEAFRRAVRMILDPSELLGELKDKSILPAYGFLPETSAMRSPEPPRPDRLRAALREAEYDGTPIRLIAQSKYKDEAGWITRKLADWGIRVELELEGITCESGFRQADLTIWCIVIAEDEVCEIEAYEHGNCILGNFLTDDTQTWIRGRIDAALATADAAGRRQILRQVEEQLRDDGSIIFLHHQQLSTYLHPSVQGVRLNRLGWVDLKNVWLETCLAAPELAAAELRP
ncbi:SgrR family transcriptional regulator [Paenibacillus albicereus]|uniref:SgrR family transcriptional regulator n=1 Tax=Paenibacillus albicereus TaxID=2726185 RepID=A0A6H2GST7_9BACL|nr:ABC transporter substrate-binding protein [Paenibacillus albicereus]QJC50470.1 SgrR family transcriptional regulator [Paenibacillus albicereus]